MKMALPWPPSLNHYWRNFRGRTVISEEGKTFRASVCAILNGGGPRQPPAGGRVGLLMDAFPPDRRSRDLDNLLKAVADALKTHRDRSGRVVWPGVYEDDSQIDLLVVRRRGQVHYGQVEVEIVDLPLARCPLCGAPVQPEDN